MVMKVPATRAKVAPLVDRMIEWHEKSLQES